MTQNTAPVNTASDNVCTRLKSERDKIGLTQTKAGELCGSAKRTIISWEKGTSIPADKLSLLANNGYDAQYVVTGTRSDDATPTIAPVTAPVLSRLREVMESEHLETCDLAAKLDEKHERIAQILDGKRRLGADILLKLCEKYRIDGNWLLRGEGLMYHRPSELLEPVTSQERAWLNLYRQLQNEELKAMQTLGDAALRRR